jgi:hypothetical protein
MTLFLTTRRWHVGVWVNTHGAPSGPPPLRLIEATVTTDAQGHLLSIGQGEWPHPWSGA